jgi:hypothetical protein
VLEAVNRKMDLALQLIIGQEEFKNGPCASPEEM